MSRCPVCSHESRAAIEQALMNGKPKATVAKTFGFTYIRSSDGREIGNHKALQKHVDKCMGEAFQKALADKELASGEAMVTRLRNLEAQVDKVIERANEGRVLMVAGVPLLDDEGKQITVYDDRILLAAVREARANVDLLARLAGKVEGEPADLDTVRRHLTDPRARKALAELEAIAAEQTGE